MKIILYVTGSISCYKSIDLTRKLVNDGNEVSVVLSQGAEKFLKVDLFLYLGARNAYLAEDDFSHPSNEIKHIELARWCDYFIVCPASANTISHLANGLTKDLGTTIFLALASDKKKLIFPAMNTLMLENKIIKENLLKISSIENTHLFPTQRGTLACGEEGAGKLLEVDVIHHLINTWPITPSAKRNILISTGASIAPLDDVRYLTNPASGKTGLKLAEKFLRNGHHVTLITGIYSSELFSNICHHPNFKLITAKTSEDYLKVTRENINQSNLFISAAAICDIAFDYQNGKLKKDKLSSTIDISAAPDVLKEMLKTKRDDQGFIGFAAESKLNQEILQQKWQSKKVDLLIGTEVNSGAFSKQETKGFRKDEANYKIFEDQRITFSGLLNKTQLSEIIFEKAQKWLS